MALKESTSLDHTIDLSVRHFLPSSGIAAVSRPATYLLDIVQVLGTAGTICSLSISEPDKVRMVCQKSG